MKLNLVDILKLGWVKILNFEFSGDADVLLMLKMKFDQDLCLNLQYDLGKMNSTLGSVVPLAMFLIFGVLRHYRFFISLMYKNADAQGIYIKALIIQ